MITIPPYQLKEMKNLVNGRENQRKTEENGGRIERKERKWLNDADKELWKWVKKGRSWGLPFTKKRERRREEEAKRIWSQDSVTSLSLSLKPYINC